MLHWTRLLHWKLNTWYITHRLPSLKSSEVPQDKLECHSTMAQDHRRQLAVLYLTDGIRQHVQLLLTTTLCYPNQLQLLDS